MIQRNFLRELGLQHPDPGTDTSSVQYRRLPYHLAYPPTTHFQLELFSDNSVNYEVINPLSDRPKGKKFFRKLYEDWGEFSPKDQ